MDAPCADIFELEKGKIRKFDCFPEGSVILTQLGVISNLEAALNHLDEELTEIVYTDGVPISWRPCAGTDDHAAPDPARFGQAGEAHPSARGPRGS
jgi:hypothetical protein